MELKELKISDKENSVKYILLVQGREVGFGYIFNREVNPIEIYIENDFQSNGYGKLLFNSLLKILKDSGLKGLKFELDENNGRLISVIKQAGAVEIGRDLPKIKFIIKL